MSGLLRKDPVSNRWVLVADWSELAPGRLEVEADSLPEAADAPDAVLDRRSPVDRDRGTLFESMSGAGQHELVVEAESGSWADMPVDAIEAVLHLWRERLRAFADDRRWRQLAVVKNHGALAGARTNQPHSEIFALPFVPQPMRDKMVALLGHQKRKGSCLLCDLIRAEREQKDRFLTESLRHAVLAPYASSVPFELMILPKGHHGDFLVTADAELTDLAGLMSVVCQTVAEALDDPAYSLVLHTSPLDAGADLSQFHWHLSLLPRLATSTTLNGVVDFNPVPPEKAVAALKEVL